jgi:hypothetical protein
MQSKYKVRLLRANLLAAAVVLALWTPAAPPAAALVLWVSVSWLFITALLLEFNHRRARGLPWQLLPGTLLIGLIAAAPERHALLIWAWCALFMLPQIDWVAAFNISGALLSWVLLAPQLSTPAWGLMLVTLCLLCLLAVSRARQFIHINGAILQRLRLIPGVNLWAQEQLLRDITRERLRCERDGLYGELVIFYVKRRQLWPFAQTLCQLTYRFEHAYRLDATTLATLLLSRSEQEAAQRRQRLLDALPARVGSQYVSLAALEHALTDVEQLKQSAGNRAALKEAS